MPSSAWSTVSVNRKRICCSLRVKIITDITIAQWKFSSQKGMKIKVLTKAGLEPETEEFPQKVTLTTEPWSLLKNNCSNLET